MITRIGFLQCLLGAFDLASGPIRICFTIVVLQCAVLSWRTLTLRQLIVAISALAYIGSEPLGDTFLHELALFSYYLACCVSGMAWFLFGLDQLNLHGKLLCVNENNTYFLALETSKEGQVTQMIAAPD